MWIAKIKSIFSANQSEPSSSLRRQLAMLSVPIFIETLLIMMLGAVDTFMLSRYSDESVAAVGVVNQIVMLAFLVFEVINLGTSVICSQYLGAGLKGRIPSVVMVALLTNLLLGLAVSGVLYFGDEMILRAMGLNEVLLPYGTAYMRIVGAFAFFQALSMTLSAALRADNLAIYPMAVTFIVNIVNIIGNYTLIFGKFGMPALGVEGAAISTATCRGIAMLLLFIVVRRTIVKRIPWNVFVKFPWRELKNLLRVGLPSAGEQVSYSSSQMVITYFINMLGVEALATRTYCVNLIMFAYLFCISIALGGAICIGHLVGHGRTRGAFLLGKLVMRLSIIITASLSLLLAIAGPWVMPLLSSNPEIISLGCTILWIDVLLEFGRPTNIFATNALRAAGDVNYPFYVGVVVMWSVAVVAAYFAGIVFGLGLVGMWIAFACDENIRGVVFIRRWYSMKWASKSFATRS
ncbi:MAG: MATE family efflux transporter [Muribaculaceae bacterium]|nr:MATE family efflux transporter [Muribaculaceae bacterium]